MRIRKRKIQGGVQVTLLLVALTVFAGGVVALETERNMGVKDALWLQETSDRLERLFVDPMTIKYASDLEDRGVSLLNGIEKVFSLRNKVMDNAIKPTLRKILERDETGRSRLYEFSYRKDMSSWQLITRPTSEDGNGGEDPSCKDVELSDPYPDDQGKISVDFKADCKIGTKLRDMGLLASQIAWGASVTIKRVPGAGGSILDLPEDSEERKEYPLSGETASWDETFTSKFDCTPGPWKATLFIRIVAVWELDVGEWDRTDVVYSWSYNGEDGVTTDAVMLECGEDGNR